MPSTAMTPSGATAGAVVKRGFVAMSSTAMPSGLKFSPRPAEGFPVRLFRIVRPKSNPYTMTQRVFCVQWLTDSFFVVERLPNFQEQTHL